MTPVNIWLFRKAQKTRHRPSLEESLLFGRRLAYAVYRLRFLAIRSVLRTFLHGMEVLLFAMIVWREFLPYFLLLRSSMAMFSGLYWGWLEQMRGEVRESWRVRQFYNVRATIDRWLKCASLIVIVQMFAMLAVLHFFPSPFTSFSILDTYIIACFIRLSMDTMSRTYHAGLYAMRRIYRPLLSLLVSDILEVGSVLLLIGWLGPWCFAPALLMGGFSRNLFTIYYTAKAYRRTRIPSFSFCLFLGRAFPSLISCRSAAIHAVANFGLQLDAWLIVALISSDSTDGRHLFIATLFHLFRPIIGAAAVWARVFYFDFKKLQGSFLCIFQNRFEQFLNRVAWVAATIVGVLLVITAPLVFKADLSWDIFALLIPFLILRSQLALAQVRAFSYSLYASLFRLSLGTAVGLLLVSWLNTDIRITLMVLGGSLLATLIWAKPDKKEVQSNSKAGSVVGLYAWLSELSSIHQPVRVWIGRCNRHLVSTGRVVRELVHQLPEARFTRFSRDRVLWFQTKAVSVPEYRARAIISAAGIFSQLQEGKEEYDGTTALARAISKLEDSDPLHHIFSKSVIDPAQLTSRFYRDFPTGTVIDPTSGTQFLDCFSRSVIPNRKLVHSVLIALNQLSQGYRTSKSRSEQFDISLFCPGGIPRLIFVIQRANNAMDRFRWHKVIRDANLRASLEGI